MLLTFVGNATESQRRLCLGTQGVDRRAAPRSLKAQQPHAQVIAPMNSVNCRLEPSLRLQLRPRLPLWLWCGCGCGAAVAAAANMAAGVAASFATACCSAASRAERTTTTTPMEASSDKYTHQH
eukprot:4016855-Pleurochrysis_carterae.AAC.2